MSGLSPSAAPYWTEARDAKRDGEDETAQIGAARNKTVGAPMDALEDGTRGSVVDDGRLHSGAPWTGAGGHVLVRPRPLRHSRRSCAQYSEIPSWQRQYTQCPLMRFTCCPGTAMETLPVVQVCFRGPSGLGGLGCTAAAPLPWVARPPELPRPPLSSPLCYTARHCPGLSRCRCPLDQCRRGLMALRHWTSVRRCNSRPLLLTANILQ